MNPVKKARLDLGLTRDEMVKIAGTGYSTLTSIERGRVRTINGRVLEAFTKLGYDKEKIKKDYRNYRRNERDKLLKNHNL